MQIADTVAGRSGHNKTALARSLDVTNPAARAGFGAGKGGYPGREVMGFRGQ